MRILNKLLGTKNEREIKKMHPLVQAINDAEARTEKLSDEEIAADIVRIQNEVDNAIKAGKKPPGDLEKADVNRILDPHMVDAFSLVREASKRVLGMRHYDVQLIGGMVLHSGRIGEMKTGEGKTLMATLPAILNSFIPGGVHVVTVNDYLASRDAEWMGRIYRFLGKQVGVVVAHQGDRAKREAYEADITYGQNNEFGFDYLRDNMKFSLKDYKQKGHGFAIVDEVDSILIDEARTPLIISGPAEDNSEMFRMMNGIVPQLRKDEHYTIDEKSRNALLTEVGVERAEKLLNIDNLYDPDNIQLLHHVTKALMAHAMYKRDVDYVVEKGEVVIVDDHTGRLMYGRRWSDGLHGAIEAKEGVKIQVENQTLATVTFQNYFRMYRKLSGMTGTADTEAEEFAKIYDLDVLVIPTNKPIVRDDQQDLIYKTEPEKVDAVVEDIREYHEKGSPILVGTVSVEKSEVLAKRLKKLGIDHNVLNAKRHRDEATIVAQAGRKGAVTIATNMAGRGTDILLGGNPEHRARQVVAERMGQGEEQVADFQFLSGRSDLIQVDKLVKRDRNESKFLEAWLARQEAEREKMEAALANKEAYTAPSDLPETIEEARDQIEAQRRAFYDDAIKIYDEVLPDLEAEAKVRKQEVLEAGGLRIIGTERHESRRIDNQLRGRAGRQGDPGSSRFYLCLEDDLMRIFGSDKMIRVMEALGMEDGVPIEHKMVSKSIENAQKRVEGMHFDSRKNVLEYDDVMNQQRKTIYGLRRDVLEADPENQAERAKFTGETDGDHGAAMRELILDLAEQAIVNSVTNHCPEKTSPAEWDVEGIMDELNALLGVHVDLSSTPRDRDQLMDKSWHEVERFYDEKEKSVGSEVMRQLESYLYLQTIDARWKEHLQSMDHLREGIHMRSYGQRDPKQEYKKEGYNYFMLLMARVRDEVLEKVFKAQVQSEEQAQAQIGSMKKQRQKKAKEDKKRQRTQHERVISSGAQTSGARRGTATKRPAAGAGNAGSSTGLGGLAGGLPGDDDDMAGMNRAQRRKAKADQKRKNRKGGGARP
jgi:preprotein translocase subunit SecA